MRILVLAVLLAVSLVMPGHGAIAESVEAIKIASPKLIKPLDVELVEQNKATARAARLIVLGALAVSEESIKIANVELLKPLNAELVEQNEETARAARLIVLGALEKVNHVLEPELSVFVTGTKKSLVYYLPDESTTGSTGLFFRQQLSELGVIRYECEGRTCGSSSYWANNIFKQRILYGPLQYQRYYAAELDSAELDSAKRNRPELDDLEHDGYERAAVVTPAAPAYITIYVAQRATGKIYVHIEYVAP